MDFFKWWDKVPQTHLYDECGNDLSWIFEAIRSGYYVPSVSQTEPGKMTITFTPAGEWMGDPITATVNLLPGEKGEKGETGATGARGPQGIPGTPGKDGTVIPVTKTITGAIGNIKTQLLAAFKSMTNNTTIGIYVACSDSTLDNLAFTGFMSKIGTVGNIVLDCLDGYYTIRSYIYNGIVTDFTWDRCPLKPGIEYPLSEVFNGKRAFVKLVDATIPINTDHNIEFVNRGVEPFRADVQVISANKFTPAYNPNIVYMNIENNHIYVKITAENLQHMLIAVYYN